MEEKLCVSGNRRLTLDELIKMRAVAKNPTEVCHKCGSGNVKSVVMAIEGMGLTTGYECECGYGFVVLGEKFEKEGEINYGKGNDQFSGKGK